MAARFFQGLGVSPGATVGLAAIVSIPPIPDDGMPEITCTCLYGQSMRDFHYFGPNQLPNNLQNDMFYEHERGQKIGLWVLAIDSGLLVGPIIGGL